MKILSLPTLCLTLALAAPGFAFSNFQTGTTEGWGQSGAGVTDVAPDSGPLGAGDISLIAFADPNDNTLALGNTTNGAFLADLLTAGVVSLSFDALGVSGNDDTLELHVFFAGSGGSIWSSNQAAIVAPDDTFANYTISLLEADLTQIAGAGTYAAEFDSVIQMSIAHQTSGGSALSSANNIVLLDNIAVNVPEPMVLALLGAAGLALAGRPRRI